MNFSDVCCAVHLISKLNAKGLTSKKKRGKKNTTKRFSDISLGRPFDPENTGAFYKKYTNNKYSPQESQT